jgi:hypothetical protein
VVFEIPQSDRARQQSVFQMSFYMIEKKVFYLSLFTHKPLGHPQSLALGFCEVR